MCVSPGFIKHNAFKMPGLGASSGYSLSHSGLAPSVSLATGSDGARLQSTDEPWPLGRIYVDCGWKSTAALSRDQASLLPRRPRSW